VLARIDCAAPKEAGGMGRCAFWLSGVLSLLALVGVAADAKGRLCRLPATQVSRYGLLRGGCWLLLGFACWLGFAFERGANAALSNAIPNANELDDGTDAGIAEAWLCETHDAGVATRTIGESWGDFSEQHAHGLLIAQ
jgi:hypothetical protein